MNQEEIKQNILDIKDDIHALIQDDGVMSATALYAFLHLAEYALIVAELHTREYNEDFVKIIVNNSNQDQS